MTNINLLPWREEAREQRKRDFVITLFVCLLLLAAGLSVWYWYHIDLIAYQKQRNNFLRTELKQVNQALQEIKHLEKMQQALVERMQVVSDLQFKRPLSVHLLDELVNALPEGIQLTELVQEDNSITLTGRAESNARVSSLMRNIASSEWLIQPELLVIEQKNRSKTGINDFSLSMQLAAPNARFSVEYTHRK